MQKFGRSEPLMNRKSVDLTMSLIRDGDIILTYEKQRFTSFFIKGKYKHASIVSAKMSVVEAVGEGVRESDLEEFLFLMDKVCIIRPEFYNHTINYFASCNALNFIGRKYDYTFSADNNEIYCSELVFLCYNKEVPSFLKEYEKKEILPQLYRDLCDNEKSNLKLIYEF
jgi:uncharacterized protein YycO